MLEAKHYPFFTVQFHPEKNSFELKHTKADRSVEGKRIGTLFAEFFVGLARKNGHKFASGELKHHLIDQKDIKPSQPGDRIQNFDEVYMYDVHTTNKVTMRRNGQPGGSRIHSHAQQ